MEGGNSKCTSSDDKYSMAPVPSSSEMTSTATSNTSDDKNAGIGTKEKLSQLENQPGKVISGLKKKRTTVPDECAPSTSSSVGSSISIEKIKSQSSGKVVRICHDEKVASWRIVMEKFREHLRGNHKKTTFGSVEEEGRISKENIEKVATRPYEFKTVETESGNLNSNLNTEKVEEEEVENIFNPHEENIGPEDDHISRSSGSKGEEQVEVTSAGSEVAAQSSVPHASNNRTSPTEDINDQTLDLSSHRRGFQEKLKNCHELIRKFKSITSGFEMQFGSLRERARIPEQNIEKGEQAEVKISARDLQPVDRRMILQSENIEKMITGTARLDLEMLNGEKNNFKPKTDEGRTCFYNPQLNSFECSINHNISKSYMISENMSICEGSRRQNGIESGEDLDTYEDFKTYLLCRTNLFECEYDRYIADAVHNKNLKWENLSKYRRKVIGLNSSFLI